MATKESKRFFAAVGDVHGHFYKMVNLLHSWEAKTGRNLEFILQVGDFEPHRHEADLSTMAAPSKYRKLGNFPDFFHEQVSFPWPIWFIGGNHEPYGFLEQISQGGKLVKNCHYLGRVGVVELGSLKVVGLSGIYKESIFKTQRPTFAEIGDCSNKDYIVFTVEEVMTALEEKVVDILLLHDWPKNIVASEDKEQFNQNKRFDTEEIGNEYGRILVDNLKPKLLICGHLHQKYRNCLSWKTGQTT
ncbi:MAG: metallophosphoesterase, partial [Spirulinaceae cyanobacterium]